MLSVKEDSAERICFEQKDIEGERRTLIIDRNIGTIMVRTDSQVFPETLLAQLDELSRVRVMHKKKRPDSSEPWGTWSVYVKKAGEHPDFPGRLIAHTNDPSESALMVSVGEKISQLAGVEFENLSGVDKAEEILVEEIGPVGGIPEGLSEQELVEAQEEQQRFVVKVYGWMCLALIITGVVAMAAVSTPALMEALLGRSWVFWGIIIAEFILVATLASLVKKMSVPLATFIFLGYAALNGVTFGVVFMAFTAESIASAFYVTAGTFGIMSLYGYVTRRDLTSLGQLCLMGLIGLIVASVVNFWYGSETVYWITTCAGVLIFVGLTAYDTQKIKQSNIIGNEGSDEDSKEAIVGALILYLDFINLFLMILRLMGKRRK